MNFISLLVLLRLNISYLLVIAFSASFFVVILDFSQPKQYYTDSSIKISALESSEVNDDQRISWSPVVATNALEKMLLSNEVIDQLPEQFARNCSASSNSFLKATTEIETPVIDVRITCDDPQSSFELNQSLTDYLSSDEFSEIWGLDSTAYKITITKQPENVVNSNSHNFFASFAIGFFTVATLGIFILVFREQYSKGVYGKADLLYLDEKLVYLNSKLIPQKVNFGQLWEIIIKISTNYFSDPGYFKEIFICSSSDQLNDIPVQIFSEYSEQKIYSWRSEFITPLTSQSNPGSIKTLIVIDIRTVRLLDLQLFLRQMSSLPRSKYVYLVRS